MEATETKISESQEKVVSKEVPKAESDKIIRQHVWGAVGVGLVPIPLVDFVALTGVQLNLLRLLAKKYEVPFLHDTVKNILSALIGSAAPAAIAPSLAASFSKFLPIIGTTAGMLTMPIIGGASTYAVGKVFVQHFASGGTFLTFDPEKVKTYYAEMFKEGQKVAAEIKEEKS